MTRIISIGECMVEMAPAEVPGSYQMGFAGDTMNTAWYLSWLLPPSDQIDYLTAVGCDAASDQMVTFLQEAGISTRHIMRRPDATVGLYMIQLQDGERSFSYWRGQSAARTLAQDSGALKSALEGADIAYVSGITLAILPPDGRETLLKVLEQFRASGNEVIFDPNLRPRLWANLPEMMSVIMQAAKVSSTVLPSFEDEASYFGDEDPAATAKRYADQGASTIIVKNGEGEILAWDNGATSLHAPEIASNVVDTTAAGDSFNAGFIASQIKGQRLEQSIAAGARLAAQVIQSRGALVSDLP